MITGGLVRHFALYIRSGRSQVTVSVQSRSQAWFPPQPHIFPVLTAHNDDGTLLVSVRQEVYAYCSPPRVSATCAELVRVCMTRRTSRRPGITSQGVLQPLYFTNLGICRITMIHVHTHPCLSHSRFTTPPITQTRLYIASSISSFL